MYSGNEMSKMLTFCGFTSITIKNSCYFFIATAIAKK